MPSSMYLLIAPHAPDACLETIEAVAGQGAGALARWEWGCKAGHHVGYARIRAESYRDARNTLPATLRRTARVVEVTMVTNEQLQQLYAPHM
jgi:hypothetical protein